MNEHIARAKERLAQGSERRARSELWKSFSRGGRLTADDCNEIILLVEGMSGGDARALANEARREHARIQSRTGAATYTALASSPTDPASGQAVAVAALPIAAREGSTFMATFLGIAGLASGVVGIGAGVWLLSWESAPLPAEVFGPGTSWFEIIAHGVGIGLIAFGIFAASLLWYFAWAARH